MQKLILIRHAKTEPYAETGTDESRKLTERGHEDAQAISIQLKSMGLTPDYVLVSTARRTRETFAEIQKVFGQLPHAFNDMLYLAEPEEIASCLEGIPDHACVAVVGHNPGIHDLALRLTEFGGFKNSGAAQQLRVKFPTASVAVFTAKEDDPFNVYNFELSEFFNPKSLTDA